MDKEELNKIMGLIDELNIRILELERKLAEYEAQSLAERVDYIEEFLSRRSRRFYRIK
ncbi:MAG: hypothetical protein GX080_07805 [Tissierellia bacterium]|nr:hypothetical protein [Tissierellia bacterium]